MEAALLGLLLKTCAPAINDGTARALVQVESSFNPYAIGVVGGVLERQPHNLAEALATAKMLRRKGWNFSVGLGQINIKNFERLGLDDRSAFGACPNLTAMQSILSECFVRARLQAPQEQQALRHAFSCYNTGNFRYGYNNGYVSSVVNAALSPRS